MEGNRDPIKEELINSHKEEIITSYKEEIITSHKEEIIDSTTHHQKPHREEEQREADMLTKFKSKIDVQKLNVLKSAHPVSGLCHLIMKGLPALVYMFMGFFGARDVSIFITCLILIALDFWMTKNLFGRYQVGLRWWTAGDFGEDFDGNGWFFESYDGYYPNKTYDNHIFWWGLIAPVCFWGFYLIIGVLSLSFFWGTLTVIASSLYYTNCHAFYLCRQDHFKKIEKMTKLIEKERQAEKEAQQNPLADDIN